MSERLEEIKEIDITPLCFYLDNMTNFDGKLLKEQWKWLINRVEELEKQRNERTHLLNAEVARNQRFKKVLEKIVNHAGTNKEIDYELWKMAKRALEE